MFWTKIFSISSNSIKKNKSSFLNSLSMIVLTMILTTSRWCRFNLIHFASTFFDESIKIIFSRIFLLFSKTKSLKLMLDSNKSNEIKMCLFLLKIRFSSFANKNKIIWYFWVFFNFYILGKWFRQFEIIAHYNVSTIWR